MEQNLLCLFTGESKYLKIDYFILRKRIENIKEELIDKCIHLERLVGY